VREVAVLAAAGADERRHVAGGEPEERQHEQARIEAIVGTIDIELVLQPGCDTGERG